MNNENIYLIGIDGGGTKTDCLVVDENNQIVAKASAGPSNPRILGMDLATLNIASSIKKALSDVEKKKIGFLFIGIPAFAEEFKEREEEIRDLVLERLGDFSIDKEDVVVGSDQEAAFISGTEKKDGVIVISGTGSVARGWNKEKEVKTAGWGYLAEGGAAYEVGQKTYQSVVEALDGRDEKTLLTEMVLEKFDAKDIDDLNKVIYHLTPVESLAPLSVLVNEAAERGDEVAKKILIDTSSYLFKTAKNTIKRLDFKETFPVVLTGGMFNSKTFLDHFREEIEKEFTLAAVIIPEEKPVYGAVKLAKKYYEEKNA